MTVDSQHVEIGVDRQDVVSHQQVKPCLDLLSLQLFFEIVTSSVDEVNSILKFGLLSQDFNVQQNELFVKLKLGLLHQLEHEKVSDIEHLGFELQVETDEVHTLNGPLCVNFLLESLIKCKGLVLLLQQFAFSHIGVKQLF